MLNLIEIVMKTSNIYFLLILSLFFCCKSQPKIENAPVQFVSIENEQKKVIGEPFFFNVAEIVLLENSDSCMMGYVSQIESVDSLLFIKDSYERLYLFDRKGKFITQIGKEGQGPGEYLLLSSFFIDRTDHTVTILDDTQGSILKYDFEGNFINSKKVPIEYIRRCAQTFLTEEGELLINNSFNFEENMAYTILDMSDSVSFEKRYPYYPIFIKDHTAWFSKHAMSELGQEIHFIMPLCDTIFCYSDKIFSPKYVMETPQKMADRNKFSDISAEKPYPIVEFEIGQQGFFTGFRGLFETEDMMLLNYKDQGRVLGFCIVDKKKWKSNYYLYTYSFDKGIPVLPIVGVTENQFIGSLECENIIQMKDKIDIDLPQYAPLKEIIEGGHFDYNPILFFYN